MSELRLLGHRIPLNIPNVLSLYRLFAFPLVLALILLNKELAFAIMVFISLNTDVWDGIIARRFDQRTEIGSRIDSLADIGVYICALAGIVVFKSEVIGADMWIFWLFTSSYTLAHCLPFIRFRRFQSLHLYSIKLGGWMQGIFFILLFFVDYFPLYFRLMTAVSLIAFVEIITIQLLLPRLYSDARGLYWVIQKRRDG